MTTRSRLARLVDTLRAVRPSLRLLAGRWALVLVPLPVALPLLLALIAAFTPSEMNLTEEAVPSLLIGLPVSVLAIFLGVRVVAGELDAGTLELAYTVPGGTWRVWVPKLIAAAGMLLASVLILAAFVFVFLTGFPLEALYAAYQGAIFHLVVAMSLAALFRGEITGALGSAVVLFFSFIFQEFRISPFWSRLLPDGTLQPEELLARAVQNRIGFALVIGIIVALAFSRADRREKMLGS